MARKSSNRINRRLIPGAILIPKDGYYKIRKIGISGERVKKDPVFHNTRLIAKEFAEVSRWVHHIKHALLSETNIKQRSCVLHSALHKVLKTDLVNSLGNRKLMNCDVSSLVNFNFNEHAPLEQVFRAPVTIAYKEASKTLDAIIPAFTASEVITAPAGITHARVFAISATFDFTDMSTMVDTQHTMLLPLEAIKVKETTLSMCLNTSRNHLCIVALGIQWHQEGKKNAGLISSKIRGSLAILNAWRTNENGRHLY